jgi:hypothetical protein
MGKGPWLSRRATATIRACPTLTLAARTGWGGVVPGTPPRSTPTAARTEMCAWPAVLPAASSQTCRRASWVASGSATSTTSSRARALRGQEASCSCSPKSAGPCKMASECSMPLRQALRQSPGEGRTEGGRRAAAAAQPARAPAPAARPRSRPRTSPPPPPPLPAPAPAPAPPRSLGGYTRERQEGVFHVGRCTLLHLSGSTAKTPPGHEMREPASWYCSSHSQVSINAAAKARRQVGGGAAGNVDHWVSRQWSTCTVFPRRPLASSHTPPPLSLMSSLAAQASWEEEH